jgi:hypothetical protein
MGVSPVFFFALFWSGKMPDSPTGKMPVLREDRAVDMCRYAAF